MRLICRQYRRVTGANLPFVYITLHVKGTCHTQGDLYSQQNTRLKDSNSADRRQQTDTRQIGDNSADSRQETSDNKPADSKPHLTRQQLQTQETACSTSADSRQPSEVRQTTWLYTSSTPAGEAGPSLPDGGGRRSFQKKEEGNGRKFNMEENST